MASTRLTSCSTLPLQGAALSEPAPLWAVQIRAGGFGAAALSPEGANFYLQRNKPFGQFLAFDETSFSRGGPSKNCHDFSN